MIMRDNFIRRHISVAFLLAEPEQVLHWINAPQTPKTRQDPLYLDVFHMGKECYCNLSRKIGKEYSLDELSAFYLDMLQKCKESGDRVAAPHNLFQLLVQFANYVLLVDNGVPCCRREQLMRWRASSLQLGQDLFTTALLAAKDAVQNGTPQTVFNWPIQLETNDVRLKNLLQQGLAENHFHLNGSTQSFTLSWAALMNHPDVIYHYLHPDKPENAPLRVNRKLHTAVQSEVPALPWETRIRYAAWIRAKLFQVVCLHQPERNLLDDFKRVQRSTVLLVQELPKIVQQLRFLYGVQLDQPDGRAMVLDYALHNHIHSQNLNCHNRLLCGERSFLYDCFLASFQGKLSPQVQNLFYLYLLLKGRLHSELIQTNQEVGFSNFSIYQDRKSAFWGDIPEYWYEGQRLAINATFGDGAIHSLEARICPKDTPEHILSEILDEDEYILYHEHTSNQNSASVLQRAFRSCPEDAYLLRQKSDADRAAIGRKLPFFYVLHFIKINQQELPQNTNTFKKLEPRNSEARKAAREQAIALSIALQNSDYLCTRIRGIDAASHEIDCRPETFSTEFRYLRKFLPIKDVRPAHQLHPAIMPRIGVTYHVGEDFLDIADGLRAIDEAIRFLELDRGDRLGHAIALGVDPEIHYRSKRYRVAVSKQNMLDNLVWLLMRSLELNVEIPLNMRSSMENHAKELKEYIYGDCFKHYVYQNSPMPLTVTLQDYYHAWQLRGDHPDIYARRQQITLPVGSFCGLGASLAQYRTYYRQSCDADRYRERPEILCLNHHYHFDDQVRRRGQEVETMRVDQDYIDLMRKMQGVLQKEVAQKGIVVECNLTSNYLIGTFKRYQYHPIFKFNQYLEAHPDANSQISVSLNTDDQGIFDTSLENEYALLAQCLAEVTDHGQRVYNDDQIYAYLEHLRQLSLSQVFLPPA